MKRSRNESDDSSSKRTKKEEEAITQLSQIQAELSNLDEKCAQEQIATQQKFDAQKKPHLTKRQEVIRKIPGFWSKTLLRLPNLIAGEPEETALKYLEEITLDDNLDARGSHTFTFRFSENPYFTDESLIKQIKVQENNADEVIPPKIDWKTSSPSTSLKNLQGGLFAWLQSEEIKDGDFGSTFRETVWEDPYSIYFSDHPCDPNTDPQ